MDKAKIVLVEADPILTTEKTVVGVIMTIVMVTEVESIIVTEVTHM